MQVLIIGAGNMGRGIHAAVAARYGIPERLEAGASESA
jgi:3-hydroxyacyl-CoA dehydrogenase